jgi:hypothetical protein
VDASVTLPWCFEDEASAWTDGLLDRLQSGDQIAVAGHWPTEISNGMFTALRRKRIQLQPEHPELFWDQLAILPIEVGPPLSPPDAAYLRVGETQKDCRSPPWTLHYSSCTAGRRCAKRAAAMSTEPVSIPSASLPPVLSCSIAGDQHRSVFPVSFPRLRTNDVSRQESRLVLRRPSAYQL